VQKALWAFQGDYIKTGELQATQKMPEGAAFLRLGEKMRGREHC